MVQLKLGRIIMEVSWLSSLKCAFTVYRVAQVSGLADKDKL